MKTHKSLILKATLIVLTAGFAVVLYNSINTAPRTNIASAQTPPSPQDLQLAMYRSGLDPQSLTAASVASGTISSIVEAVDDQLVSNAAALTAADTSFAQERQQVDVLEHHIQSGQGTQEDVSSLATARANLASAISARQSALDALHTSGTANLNESQRIVLSAIRANKQWELPVEYLTVNRTEAQWVQLREALANERIAAAHGGPAHPGAQTLLQQVRSDPTVSAAIANLAANFAAVNSAWQQAVTL